MENSTLKFRIKKEIEKLISESCATPQSTEKFETLHVSLLKKHYNAVDVSIDYHRKRVAMDIVMDDNYFEPSKVNMTLPTLHANLFFKNLSDFLNSCIVMDTESMGFYAGLLRTYTKKEVKLTMA